MKPDAFSGFIDGLACSVLCAEQQVGPTFVGVDGPGCSGKSTLADALGTALPSATVITLDDSSFPSGSSP